MHLPADFSTLPFLALYAETHFRFFRLFPSFLFMRQPEVIFDAPRRLAPGRDLPVILIANDLHRFPAEFTECAVAVSGQQSPPERFDFPDLAAFEVEHPLRNCMRAFILPIPRSKLSPGLIHITCRITVNRGEKRYIVINDNLQATKKIPSPVLLLKVHFPAANSAGTATCMCIPSFHRAMLNSDHPWQQSMR